MRIFYLILFLVVSAHALNGQCTVDADAGPDMTFCSPPPPVQLNGFIPGNPRDVSWSPRTGLSDPFILNPVATVNTTTTYTLSGTVLSNNLVVNGDFEGGNTGFSTDYALGTTSCFGLGFLDCEGTYGILTNPQDGHANFSPCSDVVGGGNMMVVNGAASFQNVWCQTITVEPNTDYDFSAWVASVSPNSPAILQFSINGFPIGPLFGAGAVCDWGQFSTRWNSQGNTSANICILNQNTSAGGNDFALDGISFSAVCTVEEDEVTIHVVDLLPTINAADDIDCNDPNSCLFLDSYVMTNGTNVTYQWTASNGGTIQSGADTPFPLVCSAGTYTLDVSAVLNGVICEESTSIDIFDNGASPPYPNISGPEEVCEGDIGSYSVYDDPSYDNYQWILISGGIILNGQGSPEVTIEWDDPDNAELCLQVSNICGISEFDCFSITGLGAPPAPMLTGQSSVCETDSIYSYYAVDLDLSLLDSINWVVPVDAVIVDGQGTDSITVNFRNSDGGPVCLTVGSNCGDTTACIDIERVPVISSNFDTLICEGTTLEYNGTTYGNGNLTGQEVFTSLDGCDSIVDVTVSELMPDLTELQTTSCDSSELGVTQILLTNAAGCDSLVITTTTFALSDTTQLRLTSCDPGEVGTSELLLTNASGCDSLVITTTSLLESDTTQLSLTSCDPGEVGTSELLLTNASGCDSLVITTTSLLESDTTQLSLTSCDPGEVGIRELLLTNASGCDSLVITITSFALSDTTQLSLTSCDPGEVGIRELLLTNASGCDSLVITTTSLLESDTTQLSFTSCDPGEVGTSELLLTNASGCDSLVITTTSLLESDTTQLSFTSCDPGEVGIRELLLTNASGCDSLVITTTSLLESDTTQLSFTSCDPGEVGTSELLLTNASGCDSLVITTTSLLESDTTQLFASSCDPGEVGTTQSLLTNAVGCDSLVITTTTLLRSDTTDLFLTSCDPNEVGTTQSILTNVVGCDSLVITTTSLLESDTTQLFVTSCDPGEVGTSESLLKNASGCDSLVVTRTSLLESDTTQLFASSCDSDEVGTSELLLTNASGCDSLVITRTSLLDSDTTDLFLTSCDPNEVGTTQSILTNAVGCDSLVITTTSLLESDTTQLFASSCDPGEVGTTQSLLTNAVGCDSLVITTTTLLRSDTTDLFLTSCDPNEVGTIQSILTNAVGCDSLVITTTTLLRSDTTELYFSSCDPNDVGTTQSLLTNAVGCDSLVITTTTLLRSDTTDLFLTSCDPNEVGTTQSILTNAVGCDSLVITTTTLLRSDTTELYFSSCDPNDVGTTQSLLTNAVGCDSLVITTTTLLRSDTTDLFLTSCDPNEVGTTQSLLTNAVGCDSLVITTTTLLRSDTTELYFSSCDPNDVGTTQSLLTNAVGCDSLILTITLLAPSDSCQFEAFVVGDTIRCNETEGSLTLVATSGPVPLNYQWEKIGAGTNPLGSGIINRQNEPLVITGLEAGNYRITVTNPNNPGFNIILDAQIEEVEPILVETQVLSDFNGAPLTCAGASDGSANVQVLSGGTAPFNFVWSDGQLGEENNELNAGWHRVTITDSEGCQVIDSVFIQAPEPLSITPGISEILCFGNNDGVISLEDVEGGTPPYHYSLNGSPLQSNSEFFSLSAGNYELMVADANGCTVSEIILINSPIPTIISLGPDTTIQLGDDIILQAFTNVPISLIDSLTWTIDSCDNCLEVQVTPLVTTTFAVSLIDQNGCRATDDIRIEVEKERNVYIPNVFSPNNDGTNDRFLIFADKTVKQINHFHVYSRWGEEVYTAFNFQPNDPQHGWDGLFRGETLNPGVFVYWAEIEFIDGEVILYKGDVTLVR